VRRLVAAFKCADLSARVNQYKGPAGQGKFELFAETETDFFLKVVDAQITFVKDDKGQVTNLVLHQNGVNQTAKKVK